MEACTSVEKEVDKVISKFTHLKNHAGSVLQDLVNHLECLRQEYDKCPKDHTVTAQQLLIIKQSLAKVREMAHRLATDHRDLHSAVSKVGKAIDRHFVPDFAACSREDVFSDSESEKLLAHVICQHFYKQGMLEIADQLAMDAGITLEQEKADLICEINRVLESLKKKDIGPAMVWVEIHRDYLESQGSEIEFKLHKLEFINLVQKGVAYQSEAMQYARTYLTPYVHLYEKDIQNLMGMFLFVPQGLTSSPYAHYLTPTLWAEIKELYLRAACDFHGISIDSPLDICMRAGCVALPALLNIRHVMQQRQVAGMWSGKDELPIEIDVGTNRQYHSVFACPILRQQSTESNPPMRLVCGHVISKDALLKLGSTAQKMKCPYCPVEQKVDEATQIYF